jgi:predicted transcriptional regulator
VIDKMHKLDNKDVIRVLRLEVERGGGQSSWARRERIDRTLLSKVLSGRKPPTKEIIRALKLCNVYALDDGVRTVSAGLQRPPSGTR